MQPTSSSSPVKQALSFPEELKDIFREEDPKAISELAKKAFENQDVLNRYIVWSEASLVPENIKNFSVLRLVDEASKAIILQKNNVKEISQIDRNFTLIYSKIIGMSEFINRTKSNPFEVNENEKIPKIRYKLLQSLEPDQIVQILSLPTKGGKNLFHQDNFAKIIKDLKPALKKLSSDQFASIFLNHMNNTNFNVAVLTEIQDLLGNLSSEQILKILATPDKNRKTALHYPEGLQLAQTMLTKLQSDLHPLIFNRIFYLKDENGNTFMHSPEVFKLSLPLLLSLEPFELKRVLKTKNNEGEYVIKFAFLSDTLNERMLAAIGIHDLEPTAGMTLFDILDWAKSHSTDKEKIKSLHLPLLLGYADSVAEMVKEIKNFQIFYDPSDEDMLDIFRAVIESEKSQPPGKSNYKSPS